MVLRERDVRFSGKFCVVYPESETPSMKNRPNEDLRFCVFTLNAAHHSRASWLVDDIGHNADFSLRSECFRKSMNWPIDQSHSRCLAV